MAGMASETLAASLGSPLTVYRCANKKADGYAVYTNVVPGGGFRGYGASQTTFAIECAMDELARTLGLDPFAIRRKNMIVPGDWMESVWSDPTDIDFGSYGLDQCMDRVEAGLNNGRGEQKPEGEDWLEGTGMALAMLECGPPTEHRSGAEMRLLADGSYHLAVGSTEMGNGSVTSHKQLAAAVLGCRAGQVAIINADTDKAPYDTGTFASTGTVVAGQAVALTAAALRDNILDLRQPSHRRRTRSLQAGGGRRAVRQPPHHAVRALRRRYSRRPPLHCQAPGVSRAAHRRLQRAGHSSGRASRHRRSPHPAQRACRRYRTADQSDAVPRSDRRRHRHGDSAGH